MSSKLAFPTSRLHLLLASVALVAVSAHAQAQDGMSGRPIVGNVQGGSTASSGNRERVTIEPSITIAYDSNVLRRDADTFTGPTDNVRSTPSLALSYNRQLGRTLVRLAGSAGYDFNSRFRYLNNERLGGNLSITSPVGALCPVSVAIAHQQYQYDLNDLERIASSVQTIQDASLELPCIRPGLSPSGGVSYRKIKNSNAALSNSDYREGHAGIRLSLPSIGALSIYAQIAELTRPELEEATGVVDNTTIRRVYVSLLRSVSPRMQLTGNVGYLQAKPTRPEVPEFSGPSFEANILYSFTPQIRLTLSGMQDVENSTGIAATYMVRRDLRAALELDVFNRTSLSLQGLKQRRRYVGNDPTDGVNLGLEESDTVVMAITRTVGQRLRFGITGSLISRDTDVPIYDFDSTTLGFTMSSKF